MSGEATASAAAPSEAVSHAKDHGLKRDGSGLDITADARVRRALRRSRPRGDSSGSDSDGRPKTPARQLSPAAQSKQAVLSRLRAKGQQRLQEQKELTDSKHADGPVALPQQRRRAPGVPRRRGAADSTSTDDS